MLALFVWGCPKRQTTTRIVYVPPPPAVDSSAQDAGALTIEEPRPPEPEEKLPAAEVPPTEEPAAKRHPRPARPEPVQDAEPELDPATPVEFPVLQPRENPGQYTAQRQQAADLQDRVRVRIARLRRSNLSTDERRMLEDASTFLAQSERALTANDFQRALTLVRKASMLAAVLEQE